jgi:5-methylcytosine-specific restriction endonuclease McrA
MSLNHLTEKTLLNDTLHLVNQEREILSKVLYHLKEIEKRKVYSDLKCGSMFEYCVKFLKYSEAQASRRVSAMRMLQEIPEISEKIETGALNLSLLNQARNFFKDENIKDEKIKKEVLEKIAGKSSRETDRLLDHLRSEDSPRKIKIELRQDTVDALRKVQGLKGHSCKDFDTLFVKMSEEVTKLWDPSYVKRKTRAYNESSRYIPKSVEAEIWIRDEKKCRQCGSQYALEIDHIRPFAMGGKTVTSNLRLLCRNCNQRNGLLNFKKARPLRTS